MLKSSPDLEPTLTIGQVAERAGLRTSAIRFYEAQGVLPEPERVSGQRRYGEDTLRRLGVIDVAKRAGFTLGEIRVLFAATDNEEAIGPELRVLAERKAPEVREMIERAENVLRWLDQATQCDCRDFDVCALFDETAGARLPPEALTVTSSRNR